MSVSQVLKSHRRQGWGLSVKGLSDHINQGRKVLLNCGCHHVIRLNCGCPDLNKKERIGSSFHGCLLPDCRCNAASCLLLLLLGEGGASHSEESPSDRCFMGPADYTVKHKHNCFGLESPSILLCRHKLLTRSRHFSSWSSPDEGGEFLFSK